MVKETKEAFDMEVVEKTLGRNEPEKNHSSRGNIFETWED